MSEKRYTAQKMREVADMFKSATNPIAVCFCDKDGWKPNYIECHVEAMLRQAADAEEELARIKALSNDERFSDWNKVSKMVEEYIDRGGDDFLVTGGGFCIRFKKTKGEN